VQRPSVHEFPSPSCVCRQCHRRLKAGILQPPTPSRMPPCTWPAAVALAVISTTTCLSFASRGLVRVIGFEPHHHALWAGAAVPSLLRARPAGPTRAVSRPSAGVPFDPDETGWKVRRPQHWLWAFATRTHGRRHPSAAALRSVRMLGADYAVASSANVGPLSTIFSTRRIIPVSLHLLLASHDDADHPHHPFAPRAACLLGAPIRHTRSHEPGDLSATARRLPVPYLRRGVARSRCSCNHIRSLSALIRLADSRRFGRTSLRPNTTPVLSASLFDPTLYTTN